MTHALILSLLLTTIAASETNQQDAIFLPWETVSEAGPREIIEAIVRALRSSGVVVKSHRVAEARNKALDGVKCIAINFTGGIAPDGGLIIPSGYKFSAEAPSMVISVAFTKSPQDPDQMALSRAQSAVSMIIGGDDKGNKITTSSLSIPEPFAINLHLAVRHLGPPATRPSVTELFTSLDVQRGILSSMATAKFGHSPDAPSER